jgi:hypothetical protein
MISKQSLTNISSAYASPNPVKKYFAPFKTYRLAIKTISIFNLNGKDLPAGSHSNQTAILLK